MYIKQNINFGCDPFSIFLVERRVRWCAVYSRTWLCSE